MRSWRGTRTSAPLVVNDDQSLYRLLNTLECSTSEPKIGEYLCSFLTV